MFRLVVLLVIAFPIMALIGLFMGLATRDRLRNLERSVESLERRIAAIGTGLPSAPGTAEAPPAPEEIEPTEPAPETAPPEDFAKPWRVPPFAPAPAPAAPTRPTPPVAPPLAGPSLEERFG